MRPRPEKLVFNFRGTIQLFLSSESIKLKFSAPPAQNTSDKHVYKPAAQAAGANPSGCIVTIRQNPPIQQTHRNVLTNNKIFMPLQIKKIFLKIMTVFFFIESTTFNCLGIVAPKIYFHKGSLSESAMTVFVKQPLASPRSVKSTKKSQ